MKKIFYPYTFWWLGPILLVFMYCIDVYFYRGYSAVRTPALFIVVFMLFIFSFAHWEVAVVHKLNKNLVTVSKIIFYISTLVLFCVVVYLTGSIERGFRTLYKSRIIHYLVGILIILNSFFSILVLALRFKKK